MKYLSPVINKVHNNLNTHITLKLNGGRYSLPAKATTKLDFDIMSLATGSERSDLFEAIRSGYISVDVMVLKDGTYTNAGSYDIKSHISSPSKPASTSATPKKAEDIAKAMGVTVNTTDPDVIKTPTEKESVSKVESKEEPALDPIKALSSPKSRAKQEPKKPEVKEESVLNTVKANTEEGK